MKISPNQFTVKKIGDAFYAVPVTKNPVIGHSMIKLNETAYFIWQRLESDVSVEAIVNALTAEYKVDRACAEQDVLTFVGQLEKVGALEGNA